jgi:hypothetical protein
MMGVRHARSRAAQQPFELPDTSRPRRAQTGVGLPSARQPANLLGCLPTRPQPREHAATRDRRGTRRHGDEMPSVVSTPHHDRIPSYATHGSDRSAVQTRSSRLQSERFGAVDHEQHSLLGEPAFDKIGRSAVTTMARSVASSHGTSGTSTPPAVTLSAIIIFIIRFTQNPSIRRSSSPPVADRRTGRSSALRATRRVRSANVLLAAGFDVERRPDLDS